MEKSKKELNLLPIDKFIENENAKKFCKEFIHSNRPKYIFGRNEFAESIANCVRVDGVIDDFTNETEYLKLPVVNIQEIPNNSLVVSVVIGKPNIAEKRLKQFPFDSLDYFSFIKYSGIPIKNIPFWEGFSDNFRKNQLNYENIYKFLYDVLSREQFYKIINFRLSYDLEYMKSFEAIEDKQYFEYFLKLQSKNEVFVDVGGFDGFTTEEFIKRCPGYKKIYFFEPIEKNLLIAKKRLERFKKIQFYQCGLSNKKSSLNFSYSASSSKICDHGEIQVEVDLLDKIIEGPVTFIKMDIEGAEREAIDGARKIISKYHPILAISVYHKADDLWKIPNQVLEIRDDYKIYLRHYTEGIAETIMFFIPENR
ncbi:MAG: FkbM family methyltransferase [Candidatus Electrothrix sp. AX5]|nr:FkbM family methyltransferase [Candidatus Electrothrix sp. AX5]